MHPQRWGDPERASGLPESARGLVEMVFGVGERPMRDVAPPPSRLSLPAAEALRGAVGPVQVLTDDEVRRLRTRGKSTPDLLRARDGDWADAPDVVVRPGSPAEVGAVLAVAVEHRLAVVPFGGGTAVSGGLVADDEGFAAVVSLDLRRLDRLVAVDEVSMTATLESGLRGPEAEARLAEHGLTMGHFPQSFEWASVGGFAATRSSGQSSAGYGRFDSLVVGLTAVTPTGEITLGVAPASAAGPDLRQVFLGCEGAFGVITSVTVGVRRVPAVTAYDGWRWPSFAAGTEAMRAIAQSGVVPTVLRLSDETESALDLADPSAVRGSADAPGGCLMIVGYEGDEQTVALRRGYLDALLAHLGGLPAGKDPGHAWASGRFDAPYLRDSLLDAGVLVETVETATFWSGIPALYAAVREALAAALGEGALVLCHISHVYETGCSLYFTVAAKAGADPLAAWASAKATASDAIVSAGGTITHHHAVGRDHRAWLEAEIGPVGSRILRAVKAELDPTGILNPGVLIP